MGVKLSELASGLRTVPVRFGSQTFTVTYRLAERLPGHTVLLTDEVVPVVARLVESWSLVTDKGKPLPVDEDTLHRVPVPVLRAIFYAVVGDNGLGEAASSSDAG